MNQLRPVPETPPRAVLYLRQSISHDDSISLELQETACRDYCAARGYQVVAVEADPGITGRTWKRPAVQRVMDMVEARDADVVILWKWSRFSRSRKDWAVAADRVEVAGGRIESATEQVDVGTATGRLTRGMLVELAAFESDRIGEVWKEVHQSRLSKGLLPTASRRYGYAWDADAGMHRVDPDEARWLVEAYSMYADGIGFRRIVTHLNAEGSRNVRGRPWSMEVLINVLDAGFGAGLITWKGVMHPGAHEPVIDEELWQAYRDRRAVAVGIPPRAKGSPYLLSGLVKCARCGTGMNGQGRGYRQSAAFVCRRYKEYGREAAEGCYGGYTSMAFIESVVLRELQGLADEVDASADVEDARSVAKVSAEGELRRLSQELGRVDEHLERLTVQLAEGVVPVEAYGPARDTLLTRRQAVVDRLEDAGRAVREAEVDRGAVARRLVDEWRKLPIEQRRELLRALIERVEVTTSSLTAVTGTAGGSSSALVNVVWKSQSAEG